MRIRKFQTDSDLDRLEAYLRNCFLENRNTVSWLPERLHDLLTLMKKINGARFAWDFIPTVNRRITEPG